jgi:hypothetical protein
VLSVGGDQFQDRVDIANIDVSSGNKIGPDPALSTVDPSGAILDELSSMGCHCLLNDLAIVIKLEIKAF